MASVRFYVEKRRDQDGNIRRKRLPILLYFSFDGKRLQLYTGERVDFYDWDHEKQKILPEVKGSAQINAYLESLAREVMQLYREAIILGIKPGIEYFRNNLKYKRRKTAISFFETFMKFIDENNERWSIYTFRKIRTSYNHLREFAEAENFDIQFERIDKDFLNRYQNYFRKSHKHSNTTIGKNIDVLKWFLNWAAKRGYNKSRLYLDYVFELERKPRVELDQLFLSVEELFSLLNLRPDSRELEEIRDIFCFICYTGIKLSVLNQLKRSAILADRILINTPSRTSPLEIPMNNQALAILQKYEGSGQSDINCFPFKSMVSFNQKLKIVGKHAGVNSFVSLSHYSGGERSIRKVPKYEVLSSKVAVNTFVYHGLSLGIPPEIILRISGKKTYSGIKEFESLLSEHALAEVKKFQNL